VTAVEENEVSLVRIISVDDDGKTVVPLFGVAGSAATLSPFMLGGIEDVGTPTFFALFLKDVDVNEAIWSRLAFAIQSGAYVANEMPLLLDCSWESDDFAPHIYEAIHEGLHRFGIRLSTVAYVQMCRNVPQFYNTWADSIGLGDERIRIYSHWGTNTPIPSSIRLIYADEEGFQARYKQYEERIFNETLPEKRFLCFNNMKKAWRTTTALLLWENLNDCTLFSYGRYGDANFEKEAQRLSVWASDTVNLAQRLQKFSEGTPFVLDLETGDEIARGFATYAFDPTLYFKSAISIITESEMSSKGHLRMTEKSFKPLAMFHPTIMCGNKGTLAALRDMGYKTFAPFIDESYDAIEDGTERLKAVHAEILRLGRMNDEAFRAGLRSIWPNVVHNAVFSRQMLAQAQALDLEKTLMTIRREFSDRFAWSGPAFLSDGDGVEDWTQAHVVTHEDLVTVELSRDFRRLRISALPGVDFKGAEVFMHAYYGHDIQPFTYSWPRGKSRTIITLPSTKPDRLTMGQFTSVNMPDGPVYKNLWTLDLQLEALEPQH
jgi:hypothetical protein